MPVRQLWPPEVVECRGPLLMAQEGIKWGSGIKMYKMQLWTPGVICVPHFG